MSENLKPGLDPVGQTPNPTVWIRRLGAVLTIFGIVAVLVALLLPAVSRSRPAARRSQCKNNLKQIALALFNYETQNHALPPAYTVDAEGRPLHSWRTLILPYLDQAPLYNSIDLSKPWNDPANAKACETGLAVFHCPSDSCPQNHTTYLASVAPNGCFRLMEPRSRSEITDRLSETLMIIEVPTDEAVPWMSPQDADEAMVMSIPAQSKLAHTGGTHTTLCDGSIRLLSNATPAATRRALISIAGKDTVGDF